jgi:hypothetical protein
MTYKVFYTDRKLPEGVSQPDLSKLIPFVFDSRDVALDKAFVLIENKAVVWKIEGHDGFQMSRAEIDTAYQSKTGRWPST